MIGNNILEWFNEIRGYLLSKKFFQDIVLLMLKAEEKFLQNCFLDRHNLPKKGN